MSLWVHRGRLHEIDAQTMHRALAELFQREHERLEKLHAQGLAGEDRVKRAALYVARERHRAGEAESGYAQERSTYLADLKERHRLLLKSGLGHAESQRAEYEALQAEFPAP